MKVIQARFHFIVIKKSECLCENLEVGMRLQMGGRFKREKTYVSLWLMRVDVGRKTTHYFKAITPQLKINKFLKRGVNVCMNKGS